MTKTWLPFGICDQEPDRRAADPACSGGKGAGLVEMHRLGIPVPPGFILPIEFGRKVLEEGDRPALADQLCDGIAAIERTTGRVLGRAEKPLLVSVRSGAKTSMPGMLDTVLNVGMNDAVAESLAQETGNPRFAADCYRRFIQSYAGAVLKLEHAEFEEVLEDAKARKGVEHDIELDVGDLHRVVEHFKAMVEDATGTPLEQDPTTILQNAAFTVFSSWNNARANRYRTIHNMDQEGGTAAIVQTMVFGNRNARSATGVMFTRNPSTGERETYGEFMPNAQGEDVVSGIRTPHELTEAARMRALSDDVSLEKLMPGIFANLLETGERLERHFQDMQEIEFTVDDENLWLLQTRSGKRTPGAALKIAVAMVDEGLIEPAEALQRCDMKSLKQMLVNKVAPGSTAQVIATGLPASPGVGTGEVVFTSAAAQKCAEDGRPCILVRPETDPHDVHGMHAATAILTTRGGMTSHAAVVARGMGKPCISGASAVRIDPDGQAFVCLGERFEAGTIISVDGNAGKVYRGEVETETPEPEGDLATMLKWAETA